MALPPTAFDTATFDAVPNSGSETGFTLIVDLSKMSSQFDTDWNSSDGTKGRAAKDSDGTEYATDWIDADNTAKTGWVRILVPGSMSAGFTVRIYPPNTGNSSNADSATFGSDNAYDSNWSAYYPLDGGNIADRTVNDNDLTAANSPTDVTGQVGDGRSYNGTTQKDETTSATGLPTTSFTIMLWAKAPTNSNDAYLKISDGTASNRLLVYQAVGGADDVLVFFPSINVVADGDAPTSSTVWHHMAFVLDTSGNSHDSYYDGAFHRNTSFNVSDISGLDTISLAEDQSGVFTGNPNLDEVQIHKVLRSADWIEHEFNQTDDNPAFWNIGAGTWTTNAGTGGVGNPWYHYQNQAV